MTGLCNKIACCCCERLARSSILYDDSQVFISSVEAKKSDFYLMAYTQTTLRHTQRRQSIGWAVLGGRSYLVYYPMGKL